MEPVEGESLASLLKNKKIDFKRALVILHDTALVIAYAHGKGVLHRDLTPETIVVNGEGIVGIANFAFAKDGAREEQYEVTMQDEVMGTASYMSPE